MAIVFPGMRGVWIGALVVLVVAVVFAFRFLDSPTSSLTGTNSVDVATVIGSSKPNELTCIRDLAIPRGTGRIAVSLFAESPGPMPRARAWLITGGSRTSLRVERSPRTWLEFLPMTLPKTVSSQLTRATVCIRGSGTGLGFGGSFVQRLPGAPVSTIEGRALGQGDIGVRYLTPADERPTVSSSLRTSIERAGVFEAGLGDVLIWVALPGLLVLAYFVVRVAATADAHTIRRLAVLAAVAAFVHGAAWAVLMPPFHGADESEHFAYTQYLAETNSRPSAALGQHPERPPYSSQQFNLMAALHHNSTILNSSSRPAWDNYWERRYEAARPGTSRRDGGGFTESASGHSPFYYSIVGIPYRVLAGATDLPSVLLAMRLFNAAIAAMVAVLAVLAAALLFRGNRTAAWTAGILAGLQPVFGSVAGAVNNDTAVNVAAAGLLYVLLRAWVRGPTWRLGAATGALAIVLPVAKITGFALLPAIGVAALALLFSHGIRRTACWASAAGAGAVATAVLWIFLLSPILVGERGSLHNVHPPPVTAISPPAAPSPQGEAPPTAPGITLRDRAEYVIQTFFPHPQIGAKHWQLPESKRLDRWPAFKIYIDRGYGLYGWKSVELGAGVTRTILMMLLAGWAFAVVAALQRRRRWRDWLPAGAILVAAVLSVLVFVGYAYSTLELRTEPGEQGRYIFPALVALSVLLASAVLAFGEHVRAVSTGVISACIPTLAVVAWLTALNGWFM
ncbi:MAG TPA: DUF2142 domain-containing protein [Baekduia sp.]|nr:DUF2142 domain-containing protein [Baekduia sp.]